MSKVIIHIEQDSTYDGDTWRGIVQGMAVLRQEIEQGSDLGLEDATLQRVKAASEVVYKDFGNDIDL